MTQRELFDWAWERSDGFIASGEKKSYCLDTDKRFSIKDSNLHDNKTGKDLQLGEFFANGVVLTKPADGDYYDDHYRLAASQGSGLVFIDSSSNIRKTDLWVKIIPVWILIIILAELGIYKRELIQAEIDKLYSPIQRGIIKTKNELEFAEGTSIVRYLLSLHKYFKVSQVIYRHPFRFANNIDLISEKDFWRSAQYLYNSFVICFLLLLPTFIHHKQALGAISLEKVLALFASAVLINSFIGSMVFQMFGYDTSFRKMLIIFSYLFGMLLPLVNLILFPVSWYISPEIILGLKSIEGAASGLSDSEAKLTGWFYLLQFPIYYFGSAVITVWISKLFSLPKYKAFLLLSGAGFITSLLNFYLITPLIAAFFKTIPKITNALF